jgi:hypothetical protein
MELLRYVINYHTFLSVYTRKDVTFYLLRRLDTKEYEEENIYPSLLFSVSLSPSVCLSKSNTISSSSYLLWFSFPRKYNYVEEQQNIEDASLTKNQT